jgi:hypothetical protein
LIFGDKKMQNTSYLFLKIVEIVLVLAISYKCV